VYFAKDSQKDSNSGEVIPGIVGQVYELLGLVNQPALTSYMPKTVECLHSIFKFFKKGFN
jgi:hypothetical protein